MKVWGSLGLLAMLMALCPRAASADEAKELAVLEAPPKTWGKALAFSPDGTRLASSGTHYEGQGGQTESLSQVLVWDVAKRQQVCVTEHSKTRTAGLVAGWSPDSAWWRVWISPDSTTLVAQEGSGFAVWDGTTGKLRAMRAMAAPRANEPTKGYTAVALSADGALAAFAWVESFRKISPGKIVNGSRVGDIAILDMKTGKVMATLLGTEVPDALTTERERKSPSWVEALAFSPDGAQLAILGGGEGEERGKVRLLDVKTAKVTGTLKGAAKFMGAKGTPLDWLADGKSLVLHRGSSIDVWDTAKGEHTDAFSLTGLPVDVPTDPRTSGRSGTRPPAGDRDKGATAAEFETHSVLSADGARLAVHMVRFDFTAKPPTMQSEVVVWDVTARRALGAAKLKVSPKRLKALANIVEGNPVRARPFPGYSVAMALSADGKLLATVPLNDAHSQDEIGEPVRVYDVSKLSTAAPVADAARARSTWDGKAHHEYVNNGQVQRTTSAVKLVITERSGEAFKGELTGANVLEISGNIDKGGSVKWEVKRIIEGGEKFKDLVGGLVGSGTLKGQKMSLSWSLKGTSHRGTFELELKE